MRNSTAVFMVTLILVATLIMAFDIRPVRASGTIYIRADGSIDPPAAPISTVDNVTYTLTGNIYYGIAVERNDTIVDGAGYTVEGTGDGTGIDLSYRNNVTVKNLEIRKFDYGIYLYYSLGYNRISGNIITANTYVGIDLSDSSNNSISGNNITANNSRGIHLSYSSNNSISGNTITANSGYGIAISYSSNNSISGNNITANEWAGIHLYSSSYNSISGNNITANNGGIYLTTSSDSSISGNNVAANTYDGISLSSSNSSSISGNTITNNFRGIVLYSSSNYNRISGNNVTANTYDGISLSSSNSSSISGNTIANNDYHGIDLSYSNSSNISGNTIANNYRGIDLHNSSSNRFFHNNFINNTNQVYSLYSVNIWDNGYPSGGNYWSDYTDVDLYKGPNQNETGSDGVWDQPYIIDVDNQDMYPLTKPYGGPAGDVDGDFDVDIFDIVRMGITYGAEYPDPRYNRLCDMDLDGDIDIFDLVMAAGNYGESW